MQNDSFLINIDFTPEYQLWYFLNKINEVFNTKTEARFSRNS